MPYATQQNLIDRFGEEELLEVADRDGDGVLDQAVVDGALGDADSVIDSYIGARYDLPLASTPAALIRRGADIARYFLYKDDATEAVRDAYTDAVKWLRDISKGDAKLDIAGSEPAASPSTADVQSRDRVFSRDTLKGF